jgi:hypothetical protein
MFAHPPRQLLASELQSANAVFTAAAEQKATRLVMKTIRVMRNLPAEYDHSN